MLLRYLVAPYDNQKGKGRLDFCYAPTGEPVVIGFKCDSGTPTDDCGCRRSFLGVSSRKGTTIAVVALVNFSPKQIAQKDADGFSKDKRPFWKRLLFPRPELARSLKDVNFLMGVARQYQNDTRIAISITGDKVECLPAGSFGKEFGV